ncbi:MerR family transcriptional regulator [Sphingomonas donggukensis]|uniref:MerR family transcriptional regulator n=1 Tax=Sphingomonas donggukensis TaxID=2949093 RepID=A0ABY4TR35_9SPHN|nr:MerR family transcriptional regulator [Sphingomonas donggukensis]URW74858.1 MerR family transcriptional regulator [Sphingomonas donggukensis]
MVRSQGTGLTIGALAKAGGVGVETIRYYQRIGLLRIPANDGGVRRYGAEDLRRLRFVRSAQGAGFTLEQARALLTLDAANDRDRARDLPATRLHALDEQIARLTAARTALTRLVTACVSGGGDTCPILDAFDDDGGTGLSQDQAPSRHSRPSQSSRSSGSNGSRPDPG